MMTAGKGKSKAETAHRVRVAQDFAQESRLAAHGWPLAAY
jgi:hypothetical protein